jgi:hypothetical protein
MPIKSKFFPRQALQGQDLPSHVIWSDLKFDLIRIIHSDNLAFKEIYNVPCNSYAIEKNAIIVKETEVDGYLGVVWSTKLLHQKASDDSIEYQFILNDRVSEKLSFSVHLFRPDVVVGDIPIEIAVKTAKGEVSPKILISNLGEGTAVVDVETVPGTKLQKHHPEFIEKFLKEYYEEIGANIARLKKIYKENSPLLGSLEKFLLEPVEFNSQSLKVFEEFINEFVTVLRSNEEFAEAIIRMLVEAVLSNSEFANFYKFVSEYFNSIGGEKMLIRDPFGFVSLSKEPITLQLKVQCVDLLNQVCTPIALPPIVISGDEIGEIPIFKLFEWGRKKDESCSNL